MSGEAEVRAAAASVLHAHGAAPRARVPASLLGEGLLAPRLEGAAEGRQAGLGAGERHQSARVGRAEELLGWVPAGPRKCGNWRMCFVWMVSIFSRGSFMN